MNLFDFDNYPHTEKVWGYEILLVNNDHYCSKLLVIYPHYRCSLHYHKLKTETFFVMEGIVNLELNHIGGSSETITLYSGDNYHLEPGVAHRFWTLSAARAVILEVSTPHVDSDSYRKESSGPLPK